MTVGEEVDMANKKQSAGVDGPKWPCPQSAVARAKNSLVGLLTSRVIWAAVSGSGLPRRQAAGALMRGRRPKPTSPVVCDLPITFARVLRSASATRPRFYSVSPLV